MNLKINKSFYLLFLLIITLFSCKTTHKTGFELQQEIMDDDLLNYSSDTTKQIYLKGTMAIDTADVNKLIYDIFRIEIDEYPENLKIYARVYDSLGNFITNMADPYKSNDSITYFTSMRERLGKIYKKRNVQIDSFKVREYGANDSIPYNIALSVDYSGSMDAMLSAIFEGTELFIKMKMKYDKIALTTFNKDLDIKVNFEKDTTQLLKLYRAKREQGLGLFSGVMDAIEENMKLFKGTSDSVPRVLVVFSDGDDNYSDTKIHEIIEEAKEKKIHIFPVAFGYSKDDGLKSLASNTGGKFYKAYTKEQLVAIFRDIYMSLRYYYYITYKPPLFWGYHHVFAGLNAPGMNDSLIAEGNYDTSDLWKGVGDEFSRPILFEFDKSDIKPESMYIIDEIVDAMMSRPQLRLEIQGHTDNVGTEEYNQKLSERRAKAVYDAIVNAGISERRLRYRGFGYSQPLTTNESEEARAKNRRTQFVVIAK